MGIGEWIAYFLVLFLLIKSFSHSSRLEQKLKKDGRVFGDSGQFFLVALVLLFPWAIRKAEKDYVEEQNKNA
jgi:uncharacterized membrane protein YbhN (UPF0104 family)